MSIRRKLHLSLGVIMAFVFGMAGLSLWNTRSSQSDLRTLVEEYSRSEELSMDVALLVEKALSEERAIVARTILSDRSGMQGLESSYRQSRASLGERLAALRGRMANAQHSGARLATIAEIENLASAWDEKHRRFWESAQQMKPEETAAVMRAELVPHAARLGEKTKRLFDIERKATQDAATDASAAGQNLLVLVLGLAVLSALATGGAFWLINRAMSDLAGSLNDMRRMAEEVTQAAGSVSGTSQALAAGATRQAASTEETAASALEVKSMAQRNSESARSAARIVVDAQEKFDGAHHALGRMEDTMGGIAASAGKIARIIKVIDDIAFQTNILSLNAAVEAARAGDAGMGFAVVADEVRGLAQRCATAAQETAALINESISRSSEGKLVAAEVASTIRTITTETLSIRTLVDQVSAGSEEQAQALDQISSAIGQIERVTQDSAANAEEAAAASEELTAQAAELRLIAHRLSALTGGAAAQAPLTLDTPKPPTDSARRTMAPTFTSAKPQRPPASTTFAGDDDQDFRPF